MAQTAQGRSDAGCRRKVTNKWGGYHPLVACGLPYYIT